jgi:hypothetical protein
MNVFLLRPAFKQNLEGIPFALENMKAKDAENV